MSISRLVMFFIAQFCLFPVCFGQRQNIESLKKLLPSLHDSTRVDCLNELSERYLGLPWWFAEPQIKSQLDSSEIFNSRALEEAREINYSYGQGKALAVKGALAYDKYEDYAQEEKLCREALYFYRKTANKNGVYRTYWRVGQALYSLSNFADAMKYLDTSYVLSREASDTFYMLCSVVVSGNVCLDRGDYSAVIEKLTLLHQVRANSRDPQWKSWEMDHLGSLNAAVENYGAAISYYKQGFADDIAFANTFAMNKQFDSARKYFSRLVPPDTNNQRALRFHLADVGAYYLLVDSANKALPYLIRSLQLNRQSLDVNQIMRELVDISKSYLTLNTNDSAFRYAKEALAVAGQTRAKHVLRDASKIVSSVYDHWHRPDSAYYYYKQYTAINDSIANNKLKGKLAAYGYEQEIELLNKEKEIQQVRLQNESLQKNILIAGAVAFLMIAFLLWRNNRHKQKAYLLLQGQKQETEVQKTKAEKALQELQSTQSQLIQSEKMASLGELTAGIAHEIQNPLNFVNNFSEVNKELLIEMKDEMDKGNIDDAKSIAGDVIENEEKINHHGKRADAIVKGMLQHSRSITGQKEPTGINVLADEYLRLSYHGLRAKEKDFNATMKTDFDSSIGKINIVPQDMGRVLLNLYNNAFYAVTEKKKSGIENYEPTVSVSTKRIDNKVTITVKDNGNGIPQKVVDKIFQPFFTTKPTGVGTGLGLSLSYDIVKAHGGEIKVDTIEGEFTEFVVQLPITGQV